MNMSKILDTTLKFLSDLGINSNYDTLTDNSTLSPEGVRFQNMCAQDIWRIAYNGSTRRVNPEPLFWWKIEDPFGANKIVTVRDNPNDPTWRPVRGRN